MTIKYIAIQEKGKFRIVNDKLFREELTRLPNGRYDIIIRKHQRLKSDPQLGYLFAVVYPMFLKLLNDAGWEFESIDEVDIWAKSQWANREVLNRETGEIKNIPALKRKFTTTDMMTYIQKIRDYASEYLTGYIPEPNEQLKIEL
jgi:hypothetical protein